MVNDVFLCLVSSADQALGATSSESQRGRDGAGAQPTTQEQLQGAAQRGEPPGPDPLPFSPTSYCEPGYPLSQARQGAPEVGCSEQAGDSNIQAKIRGQLVQ